MSGLKFDGKTVVVTGSGTGIGQAIAKRFAEAGANIVIMGRRKEPLDQTAEILDDIIKKAGSKGRVATFPGVDVSDEDGINAMFEGVKKQFGKVDIIVNNAGVSGPVKTFTNASVKEFRECVAIHLTGTFWTSAAGLKAMEKGGKIITISTFFSEENRYEQRPYRFRTPYTASQGAKNRLAECLAWELAERGIRSIATNPGPVHSDRIYKTVYPKAAAEFLRVGGYPGLSSTEVEVVTAKALPYLGDADDVVKKACRDAATEIATKRGQSDEVTVSKLAETVQGALAKMQEIAEKIQGNTSKMIVDSEFLSQDEVAEMVLNLSDEKISKLINGRVIPNDRVFYPVKPIVGTGVDILPGSELKGKVIVLTTTSSSAKDIDRVKKVAGIAQVAGAKQVIVLYRNKADEAHFKEFHSHAIDFLDETAVRRIFNTAKTHFGPIDAVIHFTGDYDYNSAFSTMSRKQWESLIDNFVYIPGMLVKESVIAMAPEGALAEPAKFKGTKGTVTIVGPDAPVGKKISGTLRARADVFRGALRPYTATTNQELGDVLGSNIKLHLVLAGNSEGAEPNADRLHASILSLAAGAALKRNEAIFYIDEARN
ncbi:SDR family NAD(P)-dependent oxidoreductase [Nitrososphaera viennensis]|nr:SDR family NAD(P)-dependent oxidoreductase [Nitrososphaera viennensis]UVS70610.1 SDR family NAD(P)-dependent oxidoreductase [Nitrososphaera viennensis]